MKCDCGILISRYMKGTCLACRYATVKEKGPMKKVKEKPIYTCRYCGKQFFPTNLNCRYCSDECKKQMNLKAAREKSAQMVTKTCLRCNKEYKARAGSSTQYCDGCRRKQGSKYRHQTKIDYEARAEKMRTIKASGLTYGQYTAGKRPESNPVYEGTIMTDLLSEHWDQKEPGKESTVEHPRAEILIPPSRLPKVMLPRKHYRGIDQSIKGYCDGQEEKIETEAEEAGAGYDLFDML